MRAQKLRRVVARRPALRRAAVAFYRHVTDRGYAGDDAGAAQLRPARAAAPFGPSARDVCCAFERDARPFAAVATPR